MNIVVVIIDDIGTENIAVYDEPYDGAGSAPPTPEIDTIAAAGVRFVNFNANQTCSPFRASAFTGLYTQGHGVGAPVTNVATRSKGLDVGINSLARDLVKHGYRTEAFGKWHLGDYDGSGDVREHPNDMGFQNAVTTIANLSDNIDGYGDGNYTSWEKCTNGTCALDEDYATTDMTDDAVAALAGTEPFFLWVSYHAAHSPPQKPPYELLPSEPDCGTELYVCSNLEVYHNMIEAMDTEFGRFMDSVDLDDTTVILVSDNGTPNDAQIVEAPRTVNNVKRSLHKWGIQTPLVITGAAVPASRHGDTVTALANSTDIYETVKDLVGIDFSASDLPTSVSLVPLIRDAAAEVRDIVFVETFAPNGGPPSTAVLWKRAIQCSASHDSCNVSYKLMQDLNADTEKFYDKNADEGEESALNTGALNGNQQTAYDALSILIQTEGAR
jgi:arylsulfatase A-like enzyme